MLLSKYDADAEHMEAMRAALSRLCGMLQIDPDADASLTEALVLKIVRLATAGELDPERICIEVLAELDAPPRDAVSESRSVPSGGDSVLL
jgi:hypothetical protein